MIVVAFVQSIPILHALEKLIPISPLKFNSGSTSNSSSLINSFQHLLPKDINDTPDNNNIPESNVNDPSLARHVSNETLPNSQNSGVAQMLDHD